MFFWCGGGALGADAGAGAGCLAAAAAAAAAFWYRLLPRAAVAATRSGDRDRGGPYS